MNSGEACYLEQIALDLVIEKKNNKSPTCILEQEIEHVLEQLKMQREKEVWHPYHGHYGKYDSSSNHQLMNSYLDRSYDRQKQYTPYRTDTRRTSGNHEELLHKLLFLLNKHQSGSGHLTDYWPHGDS